MTEKKSLTLLIIDDCETEHELYREYLSGDAECDYHFIHAYSAEEGERLYQPQRIDCIIIDYRLPDQDGLELLKNLAERYKNLPAVMLTGEGNERVAVAALQIGSQDYLPKNVITPPALKRMIDRAVERSRLLHRMEAYRGELMRSNLDLEHFANVLAHDLKSPLRAITQHLQLIEEANAGKLDPKSLKSMEFALDGAERMRRLIDALFAFSKAGFEKRAFAPVDCNRVLDGVKANLTSHIEESGAVITSDRLPILVADGMQIMQLLQNLIANAIKFCREQPRIHVSARYDDNGWLFSVADNGIGIAPASNEKIFTIFKRLHSEKEYPGCGVGLAICDRVIKNHHGSIWVESTPGEGSVFYFSLPAEQTVIQELAA